MQCHPFTGGGQLETSSLSSSGKRVECLIAGIDTQNVHLCMACFSSRWMRLAVLQEQQARTEPTGESC